MNFLNDIGSTLQVSFLELFEALMAYLPDLVAAIIILIVGLIIAGALSRLVQRLVELTKIDAMLAKIDIIEKLNQSGGKVLLSSVVGWLVKWFLILVTLIAVADILRLDSFNQFLVSIAGYFPSVVVAVLILVAGIVLGNGVRDVIIRLIASSQLRVGRIVARIAQVSIVVFAVMAALIQLQIAATLIQTLFMGIVFMLALAGGLAFGLGGKDAATELITDLKRDISHRS